MTPERIEELRAALADNKEKANELRADIAAEERLQSEAQSLLHRLQLKGRQGKVADLGEAMLRVQELEAGVAAIKAVVEPQLVALAEEAVELNASIATAQAQHERAILSQLVTEYEEVILPAWALADRIREQAKRCSVPVEKRGGLLDREWTTVTGYALRLR